MLIFFLKAMSENLNQKRKYIKKQNLNFFFFFLLSLFFIKTEVVLRVLHQISSKPQIQIQQPNLLHQIQKNKK